MPAGRLVGCASDPRNGQGERAPRPSGSAPTDDDERSDDGIFHDR
jgi:hypothetical protein